MSILKKLGLAPKKTKGVPVIGEKKKQQDESGGIKQNVYIRALILLGFLTVLVFSVPQSSLKEPINYSEGEPWRADDLTAPFTFAIQKDSEEIQEEEEEIQETTPPIFHADNEVSQEMQSQLDTLFQSLQPLTTRFEEWQASREEDPEEAESDSIAFEDLKQRSPIDLSQRSWETLFDNYQAVQQQNQTPETKSAPTDQFIAVDLKEQLQSLLNSLLNDGIIDQDKNEISNDEITVRDTDDNTERTMKLSNVRDLTETREYAQYRLSRNYYEDMAGVGSEIFDQVVEPNLTVDEEATQARIDESLENISKSKGAVAQGQVIIRRGDIVTDEKYTMLQSLAEARAQNATNVERWLRYGGDILAIISIVTIFFFYLYLYRKHIFTNNAMLLLVVLAMAIICVGSAVAYNFEDISPYIVPVAVAPIILTIIFDSRVGLLSTITLALLTGLINGNNFEYVTATTVACSLGLFSVRDIKNRSQFFFTTPGIVFIAYLIIIIGFSMTTFEGWKMLGSEVFYVAINAIFILFTYPLILLFEKSFNVTTDFTLIELSDTNLPILKDLMTRAPGTFHHSLQVSNLAEAAGGAIGANSLLCKVGGLYHDIGKMDNPHYFTENQSSVNEHDSLKPRMSALVIKAHVSNGVKIAKKHGLPEVVINFIKTHHGTSLIKFFWEKAKEKADSDKKEIREEDFRYDGPIPQTKETGILLLADAVEASSRAMKDPNYQKLDNLIDKIVDSRVAEGQLSNTPLTFQDLRTIKRTFLKILLGIYHSRVEYPEKEAHSKSTKQAIKSSQELPATHTDSPSDRSQKDSDGDSPSVDEYYNS